MRCPGCKKYIIGGRIICPSCGYEFRQKTFYNNKELKQNNIEKIFKIENEVFDRAELYREDCNKLSHAMQ